MLPKVKLLQELTESGIIAVIRRMPRGQIIPIAESLVDGGVSAIEVTVDSPDAFLVIEELSDQLKGRAIVGAGTVIDSESARLAIQSGAEFLFSPSLHEEVIRMALRYGKVVMPGVMTPSEMIQAIEWGADMVKLFPASVLGAQYVKDVKAPFPHVPVVPTGGIHLDNAASYIEAGAAAVGVGGSLVHAEAVQTKDYTRIQRTAEQFVSIVNGARQSLSLSDNMR
ncbi:bifunctional 4-hydroxy-2-oxoglutarate aldolase/2-dehydro-3-deoxy-phosphogluconate aldolase [Fictibacillus sp. WQ 8-8]|uniref:bifunctional 4-hydroxy-2-oxoglutarate aldolase/2-dehydro-3-deoxy-phosphogluconate aldolase n=1 Tax=Fictibacillus sp. WQ 8-8 TaxID=2938788 RepID=UPI0008E222CE|nr:bifunctional 4-hydroxy-2-oxoglutarate aldolase/2-dehydro-3-deoxy-phosphogluconate aldolase [Fictibacillus sp. WQ 8-8]MCQ6264579.1 bifunctional 4-hydroxy-2-oxoglutarate aldolase/2-dehydro-3-deoxy-phosphogluconate aldolase [Fictibacillus sp. WQ 8-8]SFD38592.1 2-keto-3-deoxy-phosphogluconate aldolase [Bacillus sp. OV194]